jgi:hypothetical protein
VFAACVALALTAGADAAITQPADVSIFASVIDATGKPCLTSTCTVSTTTPCAVVYFPSASGGGGATPADRLEGFTLTGGAGIHQTCSGTCDLQAGGGVFVGGAGGVEGIGGMAGAAAEFVEAEVAGDGEKPGGEFGFDAVAGGGFIDLNENGLGEVFGFRGVGEGAVDHMA